jgi:dipeptidyl aminopeptidase/acylaminoacyl peptidase
MLSLFRRNFFRGALLAACGALVPFAGVAPAAASGAEMAAAPGLIPRKVLFGNPERANPQLSPDGAYISFLAPRDGVLNIWIAPVGDLKQARPITSETNRPIHEYSWAYTAQHVLYSQDKNGDENFHVYVVDIKSGETRDATPFENVQARVMGGSPKHPDTVLLAINNRDPQLHDVHALNLRTGELTKVLENNEGFLGYEADSDLKIRLGTRMTADGSIEVVKREGDDFKPFLEIPASDTLTTNVIGFDAAGEQLYLVDSRGRDTAAAIIMDWKTGATTVAAEDARADASEVLMHPVSRKLQGVKFNYDRAHWVLLDDTVKPDFENLAKVCSGDIIVASRTQDDRTWLVAFMMADGPIRTYRYDRVSGKAEFLFTNRPALEKLPLADMHTPIIKARDGLNLVSYLTLPLNAAPKGVAKPDKPLPMVLVVHGGPWARDDWGYDALHQWLANRGYAVLSVNFRGSTGFGKKFINAADRQWGRTMHDDLLDAVEWAVKEGIADPARVAILGGSYGGYATLWGMTNTPDVFACGVDIVGPSNLLTLINSIPPYWAPMIEMFAQRVGDPRTEEGKALLTERSPLTYVSNIKRPLLIGQGANDPRVKQAESDQIVSAMQARNIPVTYVLYPDEGHGFHRPENSMSFWAVTEAFLAQHLGGRYEPIGDDFQGATLQVPAGADQVPGLQASLSAVSSRS